MEIYMRPCPFCGSKDAPKIAKRYGANGWRDRYAILCDYEDGGCGSESGWYHELAEAVGCWNMRGKNEDVVQVVRCKDCKYWDKHFPQGGSSLCEGKARLIATLPDDFCSDGERREQ